MEDPTSSPEFDLEMTLPRHAREILGSVGWLSNQPPAIRDAMLDVGELRKVNAGKSFTDIGELKGPMYAVVSGWVDTFTAPLATDPILLNVVGAGSWGGETAMLANTTRRVSFAARTECEIAQFSERGIRSVGIEYPDLQTCFSALFAGHIELLTMMVTTQAISDPNLRVRMTLLRLIGDGLMSGWNDTEDPKEIPISQGELAELAMLSRNPVGTVLKELQNLGAIKLGYKKLIVHNRQLLRP